MSECPIHGRAVRCHHHGEAWVAEYRYKNGKWKLDVWAPDVRHLRVSTTSTQIPKNADQCYENTVLFIRGERATLPAALA